MKLLDSREAVLDLGTRVWDLGIRSSSWFEKWKNTVAIIGDYVEPYYTSPAQTSDILGTGSLARANTAQHSPKADHRTLCLVCSLYSTPKHHIGIEQGLGRILL